MIIVLDLAAAAWVGKACAIMEMGNHAYISRFD